MLGTARDGEVLAGHLDGLLEQVPADLMLGPVPATVTEHLAPRLAAARRAVVRALDSPRYLALLDELDALLAAPPGEPAAAAVPVCCGPMSPAPTGGCDGAPGPPRRCRTARSWTPPCTRSGRRPSAPATRPTP